MDETRTVHLKHGGKKCLCDLITILANAEENATTLQISRLKMEFAEEIFLGTLNELIKTTITDDVIGFRHYIGLMESMAVRCKESRLRQYAESDKNPFKTKNLLISACKHESVLILDFLLDNDIFNSTTLKKFSVLTLSDKDETGHNAFYYAILTDNVFILQTLIMKWPGNYIFNHVEEFYYILLQAMTELKLKNVLISEKMEYFVEENLIAGYFVTSYSNILGNVLKNVNEKDEIKDRIKMVIEIINSLKGANLEKVDAKFVFSVNFIARNIHLLKKQLKSTYARLPWEELEFCLIRFVSSYMKFQGEVNLFCATILNQRKILHYLDIFANKLEYELINIDEIDIVELATFPIHLNRNKVIVNIMTSSPQFGNLYKDYQQLKDIYSLHKINEYITFALSADIHTKEGQLVIIRMLQVMARCSNNTLQWPNLSTTITKILLLILPKDMRKIIQDIRHSDSQVYLFSYRSLIENSPNTQFFAEIKNIIQEITLSIDHVLSTYKIHILRLIAQKIIDATDSNLTHEIVGICTYIVFVELLPTKGTATETEFFSHKVHMLKDLIKNKTMQEENFLTLMDKIVKSAKENTDDKRNYYMAVIYLRSIGPIFCDRKVDQKTLRGIKHIAGKALYLLSSDMKPKDLKIIAELTVRLYNSVKDRSGDASMDELCKLCCSMLHKAEVCIDDISWKMCINETFHDDDRFHHLANICEVTQATYHEKYLSKSIQLKNILKQLNYNPSGYKENPHLQAVVETLTLDLMVMLELAGSFIENNLAVEENIPVLTGKYLYDHLAFDNPIVDIFLTVTKRTIFANAENLCEKNPLDNKQKIGKTRHGDLQKLQFNYNYNLKIIDLQEKMFLALEEGSFECLKTCLNQGAEIQGRTMELNNGLHHAAKLFNQEITEYVFNNCNYKPYFLYHENSDGQNPLHVSAMHGVVNLTKYFVEDTCLNVNTEDIYLRTPLILAAQNGHKDSVIYLLKNCADPNATDLARLTALHYAVKNGHTEIAIILKPISNRDVTTRGISLLHLAAENGNLDLVRYFILQNQTVNIKTVSLSTPLHLAILRGHLDVVTILISNGADVNSKLGDSCSPLYLAAENGRKKIVDVLLEHNANLDCTSQLTKTAPLHIAAYNGHRKIVQALLMHGAFIDIKNCFHKTPLHFAARNGHLKSVSLLLKYGANIESKDVYHATPLYYAVEYGHRFICDVLIKAGAEVNARAIDNSTPLYIAALNGHVQIINMLLKNSAVIDARDKKGNAPLHAAAINGKKEVIKFLLNNSTNINIRNNSGATPLHAAVSTNSVEAVELLIKSGASLELQDSHGLIPLHIAILNGNKKIIRLLIRDKPVNTHLMRLAVEKGDPEITKILLSSRAVN